MEQSATIAMNSVEHKSISRVHDRTISDLYRQWVIAEKALSDGTSHETENAAQAGLEAQTSILGKLIDTEARSISYVLLTLHVWRDMIAPDGQAPDWVSPSDKLALSAIADLETHAKLG